MVTNNADSGAGSLRQAIAEVISTGDGIAFDTSQFGSPKTIILTSGELVIPANTHFFIAGPGADKLTISGNGQSRVLFVDQGANVAISGVTIADGNGVGSVNSGNDGGISNFGNLNLTNTVVRNNSGSNGGGIGNNGNGVLTVIGSTIRNNAASGTGGGVYFQGGSVNFQGSTINDTSAAEGGGMGGSGGTASVVNSTFHHNFAGSGGGISAPSVGTIDLRNVTVSGNFAIGGPGGGVWNQSSSAVSAVNTIFADNDSGVGSADFAGVLTSQGYNLIQNTNGTTIDGVTTGNILGQDPGLLPLKNYGGPTQTQALRIGSPAVDRGVAVNPINTVDQRGFTRPINFPFIGSFSGGNNSDIGAFERQFNDKSGLALADFDGDGRSDVSVQRPADGSWFAIRSSDGGTFTNTWGNTGDVTTPGDFDGDGKTDLAVYRPSSGQWFVLRSSDSSVMIASWGNPGDVAEAADFDGDGKTDVAVYRPSTGVWYALRTSDGGVSISGWGNAGDVPVPADYDGDGKTDVAVYRPSTGVWYMLNSTTSVQIVGWGQPGDKPVEADYDGDGKDDIAVYRPSDNNWYVLNSSTGIPTIVNWGNSTDQPVPADYDGDGKTDIAVFREGNWYILKSTGGVTITALGTTGDVAIPARYIP